MSPAAEDVGDDEVRRVGLGLEPLVKRVVEVGEGEDDSSEGGGCVLDVLHSGREVGARREREDERVEGGVGGEEGVKEREVLGSGEDGDGEARDGGKGVG